MDKIIRELNDPPSTVGHGWLELGHYAIPRIKLDKEESKEIAKNTGFTNSQVNNLYKRFHELDKNDKGYLSQGSIIYGP